MDEADKLSKAMLLIQSIEEALARGTKHYDIHGAPLTTTIEIIEALQRDERIVFEPAEPGMVH